MFVGCAQAPTKTFDQSQVRMKDREVVSDQVIVVDARPSFQYEMSRVPGSIPMQWRDFSEKEERFEGLLEKDLFFHTRRLARMGIGPESQIIVLGNGKKGSGEEGRVAWTLRYLGITNVKFARADQFSLSGSAKTPPPRPAVEIWKPNFNEGLILTKTQFLNVVHQPRMEKDAPVIIDVRPVEEYTGKQGPKVSVDYGAVNIPWTEFITDSGAPNPELTAKLEAVGIGKNRSIALVDWNGLRSGLVTVVLRDLGYKAANFAGGYQILIDQVESSP